MKRDIRLRSVVSVIVLTLLATFLSACSHKPPKPPKDKYSGMTTPQVRELAMKRLAKGQWYRARDALQKALTRSDTVQADIALTHLALADAYYHDGGLLNLAEALTRYSNFITFYPNHEKADYAQFQVGLCHLKQTLSPDRDQAQTRKALAELLKVEAAYPGSAYAQDSAAKAAEARELLAEHDFRVANFYYRDRSYAGAVDRLRQVLEEYPRYSGKDRIYLALGKSLVVLRKKDEGRLYLEKLVTEFPGSRHAEEARTMLEESLPSTQQASGSP